MNTGRVAVVQMRSGQDVEKNLKRLEHWIAVAAKGGAQLVAFPENCLYMGPPKSLHRPRFKWLGTEFQRLQETVNHHRIEVLVGSMPMASPQLKGRGKVQSAAVLFQPHLSARKLIAPIAYHKIHLFDVDLANGEKYRESASITAGKRLVVASSSIGKLGLSICYDLRFPELYRHLMARGAQVIAVPAAFTYETGRAHWLALLKARAIENLAYVLAPAQWGSAFAGRRCWGHSMILDPWGKILAEMPLNGDGIAYAKINLEYQKDIRRKFPALKHRKLFTEG